MRNHLGECDLRNCYCNGRLERNYYLGLEAIFRNPEYRPRIAALLWSLIEGRVKDLIVSTPVNFPPMDSQAIWEAIEPKVSNLIEETLIALDGADGGIMADQGGRGMHGQ